MTDEQILSEIGNQEMKRNDIAVSYKVLMKQQLAFGGSNWRRINKAIISRWSVSGLEYIKNRAWKLLEQDNAEAK